MILKWHDEKTYNFWGGIYQVPEPDTDDAQCTEIAAICDNPQAPHLARLFCASPRLHSSSKLALEALEYVKSRGGDFGAPGVALAIEQLRLALAEVEETPEGDRT